MLIFDGCASFYNDDIINKGTENKTVLVLLSYNDTHIVQPLYIAVFNTVKTYLNKQIYKHIIESSLPSLTKIEALE